MKQRKKIKFAIYFIFPSSHIFIDNFISDESVSLGITNACEDVKDCSVMDLRKILAMSHTIY